MKSSKEIDGYDDSDDVRCIYDVDYNCGHDDDDNEDYIFDDDDECGAKDDRREDICCVEQTC